VFGDLVDEPRFVEPYLWTLASLHRHGARATLQALLHEGNA
jgi:mannitol 2-dehydrogenase